MIALVGLGLAGELVVTLSGVVPDGHPVEVALFAPDSGFPTLERAVRTVTVPADAATLTVRLGDVAPGDWAVAVLHDQNSNGALDFRWLPPGPAEGTSASCPSRPFAMPTWSSCHVAVGANTEPLTLEMWY